MDGWLFHPSKAYQKTRFKNKAFNTHYTVQTQWFQLINNPAASGGELNPQEIKQIFL
jgi:hypothetical protein